jgi:hypothetical protein
MQVSSVWRTFLPLQKKVFPIFEAALEVQRWKRIYFGVSHVYEPTIGVTEMLDVKLKWLGSAMNL